MAKGFFSPKLTLHVGDGFEFMKQNNNAFDVIITDSSDPVGKSSFVHSFYGSVQTYIEFCYLLLFKGPAESLFKESYFQLMKSALKDGGILCSQGNFIFHSGFVIIKGDKQSLAFSISADVALCHKSVFSHGKKYTVYKLYSFTPSCFPDQI